MDDLVWSFLLLGAIVILGMAVGRAGRGHDDLRARRRWDAAFDSEIRRITHTDATGMLLCRSCGASASERSGRCPACGASL